MAVGSELLLPVFCYPLRVYIYTLLALWLYSAYLPVTDCFLGHHIDEIHVNSDQLTNQETRIM